MPARWRLGQTLQRRHGATGSTRLTTEERTTGSGQLTTEDRITGSGRLTTQESTTGPGRLLARVESAGTRRSGGSRHGFRSSCHHARDVTTPLMTTLSEE
ncbi:hypothetical protein GCM10025331_57760 [Actinoplanes utahensis]|uniref:Uncharacterized protein n=1 Tax=Actinoplanes utahensis TaxID=1869 RepID=A0A0A6XBB4_ACTUT|nr:hypothetical protein MB27_11450 [Actinoplanes utahensis]GIF32886.1 hypothetical protein Aut01nite_58720 [Actinoplanes utahensis]